MPEKFYITTALPYINAPLHLGFAMELIQGDVLARYHRQLGDDTYFVTGSDENALKNVQAAEREGLQPKKFMDYLVGKFHTLIKMANISNDDFIRTTDERHVLSAQKFWRLCDASGDIYKKKYKGLYCVGCEEFKTPKDLVGGKCSEHLIEPEEIEEENYFFRLSKYQSQIEDLIDTGKLKIIPETRKNEVREFIHQGLDDFSISRSNLRARNWGIAVPGDDSQRIFVWFDALINYISVLGFAEDGELFKKYWQENKNRCHLVGKGITRFHAIYWPAMLMSAGIKPPSTIYVHGYLNLGGEKMSKSVGNVVDPLLLLQKYKADVVRYFLLREISTHEDGDFSEKKLVGRYNGDLANGLGNLVQRVATLIESNMDGELIFKKELLDKNVETRVDELTKKWKENINVFVLHEALGNIWELISFADKYMDDRKPWAAIKHDEKEFLEIMTNLVAVIHSVAWMLLSFMPETADKIAKIFGDDLSNKEIPENYKFIVKKSGGLFPRLN